MYNKPLFNLACVTVGTLYKIYLATSINWEFIQDR